MPMPGHPMTEPNRAIWELDFGLQDLAAQIAKAIKA